MKYHSHHLMSRVHMITNLLHDLALLMLPLITQLAVVVRFLTVVTSPPTHFFMLSFLEGCYYVQPTLKLWAVRFYLPEGGMSM